MANFNFLQTDSDLTVWLTLDGKEYEVEQFNIEFTQSVDLNYQPQDEVRGGRISITLTQTLPESLYKWAMKNEPKNGSVVFRSQTESSPLKVEFKNSYCVKYNRDISNGGGITTKILISPDEILINNISFDNHWVE